MTDEDFPEGTGAAGEALDRAAAEPLDESDLALLGEVAAVLTRVDPVPEDLVARISFSLALDEVYAEVAQITRVPVDELAVRSDPSLGMRTETLTFSAENLSAMVTVSRPDPEQVRIDGWIAPQRAMRITVRMQEGTQEAETDEDGRFVLEDLPAGFAQLTFTPVDDPAAAVVTPLFQL